MDNPAALKHLINASVIKKIARAISRLDSSFDSKAFLRLITELEALELKQRVLLVTKQLQIYLKHPYPQALELLMSAMEEEDLKGFELWPFSEFISQGGIDHFDLSMKAMYRLTQRFTAEFAVRPFLLKNHTKVLKYFSKWAVDKNVHVRRLVSEGSRPLLPWAQNIPLFIMDPTQTILLLDKLKFDDELYVRKSVANHLNDISKNHPQVVIDILRMWSKNNSSEESIKIEWIKRHALRTLIKKGHAGALKLMGVTDRPVVTIKQLSSSKKSYKLNDVLSFSFNLESLGNKNQKLIIDYAIDFVKANGKRSKKVYKLKTLVLAGGEKLILKKNHSLKPITTMMYYSGTHHLLIQINGKVMGQISFFLEV
jgi:3-methyladenine DNA glycosylase AlkC